MQVPKLICSLRACLVHRLYLHKLTKKVTRLMPPCLVFVGLLTLLLLTLIQLLTYQSDFVHYPMLPEPSELIRTMNATKRSNPFKNSTIPNSNAHDVTASKSSTFNSAISLQLNSFTPTSHSLSTSINAISSNLNMTNVTHHDFRQGLSRMIISSNNKTGLLKAKKSDSFKIEALLSQSTSAFQTNNREMNELTNKGRIKQIIKNFLFEKLLEKEKLDISNSTISSNDTQQQDSKLIISTNQTFEHCPLSPPNLVGRMRVDLNVDNLKPDLNRTKLANNYIEENGFFRPNYCLPQHKVAIIIPYRDRELHLHILLKHLHGILQRQLLLYKIFVIEQYGNETFNKGVLMNAGAKEAASEQHIHCFVFHDVDMVPEDDRTLYSCPNSPRHLSVAVDKFNYSLPYSYLIGGVFAISQTHFNLVNGYSNLFWGWGGEDDDLSHRLKYHSLHIIRPPESIGRYTMIKHDHRKESPSNVRYALLRMSTRRSSRDGLSSVHYKVVGRNYDCNWGFEHITIAIGSIHKWHFYSKNKLILHF